jgi:hypothetical protein
MLAEPSARRRRSCGARTDGRSRATDSAFSEVRVQAEDQAAFDDFFASP